jgi:hypothetical protein
MNSNISESATPLHRVQPFQVRKVRERSFFSRVFAGSRPTDAEAAVENLIAERGLDNLDAVAIDNCLHQYGIRDAAVRPRSARRDCCRLHRANAEIPRVESRAAI